VLFLLCACVSVSGVLFSVGVCVCDLLIFSQERWRQRLKRRRGKRPLVNPGIGVNVNTRPLCECEQTLLFFIGAMEHSLCECEHTLLV